LLFDGTIGEVTGKTVHVRDRVSPAPTLMGLSEGVRIIVDFFFSVLVITVLMISVSLLVVFSKKKLKIT